MTDSENHTSLISMELITAIKRFYVYALALLANIRLAWKTFLSDKHSSLLCVSVGGEEENVWNRRDQLAEEAPVLRQSDELGKTSVPNNICPKSILPS